MAVECLPGELPADVLDQLNVQKKDQDLATSHWQIGQYLPQLGIDLLADE